MILKICLVVAIVTIIGLVAFQMVDPNISHGDDNTTFVDDNNTLTIGVTGEVAKPGEYVLSEGACMEDLLAAAGGITTNGDERCFFLETEVVANNSYYIPPKYDHTDVCSEDPIVKVNINEADVEELMTLNGFGETVSESLIDYRNENGIFYTIESIMNVTGIGNSKFNLCKNYIILHD